MISAAVAVGSLAATANLAIVAPPVNAVVALLAALSWGGGDFSGGMGVRVAKGTTGGALRFIVLAHTLSLAALLCLMIFQHASLPQGAPLWWALGAGVAAGASLTAFYIALARGVMGASAALSGVIAAAIPALVSSWVEGVPHALELAGFVLACVAIWVIAASPATPSVRQSGTTMLALAGGFGFGIYFTALRFANPLGVLEPIALARVGSLLACGVLLLLVRRGSARLQSGGVTLNGKLLGWAIGVAVLDTAGNLLFTWSTRMGRLDVAAVLASLYPASTILLAAWRLHERPTRQQWLGMGIALAAVVLITL